MTRRSLALALPALALFTMAARKPTDPKHENQFRLADAPKSDVVTAELSKAEAQSEFVAVDARFTNTTSDRIVVFRKGEAIFTLPQGTFQTKAGGLLGGPMFIPPGESRSIGFKVEGESGFHVDSFTFEPKGFSVADNAGTTVAAPSYTLPPSANNVDVGPFSCNLTDTLQKTDNTTAGFQCTYNGKGVGFIDARRIGARSKSGKEYANMAKNTKRDVLLPGDKAKFPVWIQIPASDADMQFVAFDLLFRDAFSESPLTPVDLGTWRFELDPEKTAAANK